MDHIQIEKTKILEIAKVLKQEISDLKIFIKLDDKNKKIYLRIKKNLPLEEIKKIESIIKVYFEDYFLKILVD